MELKTKNDPLDVILHETCTSSDLPGVDSEHLDMEYLNNLHEVQTGAPISNDPLTARIQREQAIVREKHRQRST